MSDTVFVYNDDFVPTAVFFVNWDQHHELHQVQDFQTHCRKYVMPTLATHEEKSIDAQNPDHAWLQNLFVFVAW